MEARQDLERPLTVAAVRIPRAGLLALGAGFAAFGVLLFLGRNLIFFYDEWTLITQSPRWTLVSFFQPHNEHWSTLLKLTYEALLLRSEEHTSELQSRGHLVCRLLLE